MSKVSKNNEYMRSGVTLSPSIPEPGDKVKLSYDGLLAKSGATDLYAHVGFGDSWDYGTDYQMKKSTTSFEATLPVIEADTINVCFKDSANNWDNNCGKNYSFEISR